MGRRGKDGAWGSTGRDHRRRGDGGGDVFGGVDANGRGRGRRDVGERRPLVVRRADARIDRAVQKRPVQRLDRRRVDVVMRRTGRRFVARVVFAFAATRSVAESQEEVDALLLVRVGDGVGIESPRT